MKITIQDYPILLGKKLELEPAAKEHIKQSKFASEYEVAWARLLACQKYRVVSSSIFNHLDNHPKLMSQVSSLAEQAKIEPCWYLYRGYTLGTVRSAGDMTFIVAAFGTKTFAAGGVFLDETDEKVHYDINPVDFAEETMAGAFAVMFGRVIPTFIEFAKTESVILNSAMPGNHKTKLDEKYITDSKVDVEILDSTWYRELIHLGDFGVNGHFRLQPYGPMNNLRKLIYIKDFVKHGYHRIARKDKDN